MSEIVEDEKSNDIVSKNTKIVVTSCSLGGHVFGRGTAVQKAIQEKFPDTVVENKHGLPLQFQIKSIPMKDNATVENTKILAGQKFFEGAGLMLKMLLCVTSPNKVAEDATGK